MPNRRVDEVQVGHTSVDSFEKIEFSCGHRGLFGRRRFVDNYASNVECEEAQALADFIDVCLDRGTVRLY